MTKKNIANQTKKILITGASGMVGSLILQYCLEDSKIDTIISLVREPSGQNNPKLKEIVCSSFTDYAHCQKEFKDVSVVYFCIGVYTGAVQRKAFRQITVDYPIALAKVVFKHSPKAHFCLLSGSGADRTEKSTMMFAQDKGVAENQLSAIGFSKFYTFRPGYIYPVTPRKEPNFTYRLARWLYPLLKAMGPSASITSEALAQAIFSIGQTSQDQEVFENKDMIYYLDNYKKKQP